MEAQNSPTPCLKRQGRSTLLQNTMENNQLIARTVISTRPVAVSYEITDFGRTALEFLEKLKEWVENQID